MEKGILYIQENKEFAGRFQKRFAERGIELLTAASASDALTILSGQAIVLLLIDYNMTDMPLGELVERCRPYPDLVFAVCIEEDDPLLLTTLVNRYRFKKLFPAPWDIDEIIDEIEDAVKHARILAEQKEQKRLFDQEKAEFEKTLDSLTGSLKKQQYSYYKLSEVTQILLTQLKGMHAFDSADFEEQYRIIEDIFTTMLKMRTTGTANIDGFEAMLLHDMERIEKEYPGFHAEEIHSCLTGRMRKGKVVNIRFVLWLLAKYGAVTVEKCRMSVTSKLLNPGCAAFEITLKGVVKKPLQDLPKLLIKELLDELSIRWKLEEREDALVYRIEFKTASAGEH